MSNDRKTRLRARPHDYNVGFGKPPEEHRFKKGESGNPAGRPRGAKSGKPARPEEWLKAIVLEEAYRDITVGEGDRTVTMPMAQAVIRTLAIEAAKGKPRPQRLFTEMLSTIEQEKMEEHDGFFKTAMDYKLTWEEELERRERLGITDAELPWCITLDNSKGISRLRFWCKNSRVNGINDLPVFMHQGRPRTTSTTGRSGPSSVWRWATRSARRSNSALAIRSRI